MVLKLFNNNFKTINNNNNIFHQGDLSVLMKKSCFVPTCLNTSENAPNKIFIFVPRDTTTRKYWFEAVGLNVVKTTKYCCEDHFNLKEDSVDFYFYKRTGKTPRIKSGIVPHLFLNVCNSNIFYTQLEENEENISSEDEKGDFYIPQLKPAGTESSSEKEENRSWEKPKIENVEEYFMETSDVQNIYAPVKIGAPEVKIETDDRFFENQNIMGPVQYLIVSSGSSTDTASPVNDQTLDIYKVNENFKISDLEDDKNFLEIGPGPSNSCEQNFSQNVPFNVGVPEVKIEVNESNESFAQIPSLPFVSCTNTLETIVKTEPVESMPAIASEVNNGVQNVQKDACIFPQIPSLPFVSCTDTLETIVKKEPDLEVVESMPAIASEVNNGVQNVQKDACGFFGDYVAAELRSLPFEERFQIQQEIQNCLSAAVVRHISKLGASESTKVSNLPS